LPVRILEVDVHLAVLRTAFGLAIGVIREDIHGLHVEHRIDMCKFAFEEELRHRLADGPGRIHGRDGPGWFIVAHDACDCDCSGGGVLGADGVPDRGGP